MRTENSARPPPCRRCVCLRERVCLSVRPSVRPSVRARVSVRPSVPICEELPLPLEHFLQRMARRPRPQQFFGLMGKRDAGYGQISHKRSSERSIAQNYERRRK
ncbi:PREDICTED: protachykinin-1 [Aptenodytes forsteri]|uniref:protachykinin-1 n=1 Tax=Aptenodytes forsteri TaxID=9233 RepID=UPI0004F440B0|nr:PREDICTED: protachykinin-1 [Aptenodytes forsteri]